MEYMYLKGKQTLRDCIAELAQTTRLADWFSD